MIDLTDQDFEQFIKKAEKPVLVDFWAQWCVDLNTNISINNFDYKKAKEIGINETLLSYDGKHLLKSKVIATGSSKESGHCLEVETETGRTIKVTNNHQFYTPFGWKQAQELKKGQEIAIYSNRELLRLPKSGKILVSGKDLRKITSSKMRTDLYISRLEERGLLPLKLNNPKLPILARLIGSLFSDGNLYSQKSNNYREISFSIGSKNDVKEIKEDLEQLGFKSDESERVAENEIMGRFFTTHTYRVRSRSTALWLLFKALGVPEGNKTNIDYQIPKWLIKSPFDIKREFLSAYLGGDGPKITMILISRPNKKPCNCLHINDIEFHKRRDLAKSGEKFAKQIAQLLSDFGVEIKKIFIEDDKYKRKDGTKSKIIHIRFASNYHSGFALCQKIGYCYSQQKKTNTLYIGEFIRKQLFRREKWQRKYTESLFLYKQKKLNIKEIAQKLNLPYDTVFGWIGYKKKATTPYHYEKYPTWLKEVTKNLKGGLVWEKIEKIEPIYLKKIQGITLEKIHNFIANGFLVHNCSPCLILGPILEKLVNEYEKKLTLAKVNLDTAPRVAQKYGIEQIPTVILFKEGKPVSGFIGVKPETAIKEWLDNILREDESLSDNEKEKIEELIKEVKEDSFFSTSAATSVYEEYARKNRFKLNPNREVVEKLIRGLLENEKKYGQRYCPCRRVTGNPEGDRPKICPCQWHREEIERDGHCFCELFFKKVL